MSMSMSMSSFTRTHTQYLKKSEFQRMLKSEMKTTL